MKNLYIFTDDICFDGIEVCTQLSNIFIFLVRKKKLNKVFGDFENLKCLITNCAIENNTNFVSKNLEIFVCENMGNKSFIFNTQNIIIKERNKYLFSEETIYNQLNQNCFWIVEGFIGTIRHFKI